MSAEGLRCLMQHLTDPDSLRTIAREGLDPLVVPDEGLRPLLDFAIDYFHNSGQVMAPSTTAILSEPHFADALSDADIDIEEEPGDSVEWAMDDLKGTFLYQQAARFNRTFATAMADAISTDRPKVLATAVDELIALSMSVERKNEAVDIRQAMDARLLAYEARAANRDVRDGLTFGLPLVDEYTNGIRPGELAILAAGAKFGKSYFLDLAALRDWQAGKLVCIYTLENSVDMTLDRIACLATGVSPQDWERGLCHDHEIERVRQWIEEMKATPHAMWVNRPPIEKRRVTNLVRDAQLRGCESLFIDQLSHIVHADPRLPRHLQIGESLREMADLISSSRGRMPCLLAHQINREGVKAAHKRGHYEMTDLAESADAERTADWVFGFYQSEAQKATGTALLQTMAVRRAPFRHFNLIWNVDLGQVVATSETTLGD